MQQPDQLHPGTTIGDTRALLAPAMTFNGFTQELVLEGKVLFEQIGERMENGPRGVRGGLMNEGSQGRVLSARSSDQLVLPTLVEPGQDRLFFGAQLGLELFPQSAYCLLGIGESQVPSPAHAIRRARARSRSWSEGSIRNQ